MLICRLGWMLVAVGLIVRDMSGQERDLLECFVTVFYQKNKKQNCHLEERKIEEACRHEAATAIAMPEKEVLQTALSHFREALSVACL